AKSGEACIVARPDSGDPTWNCTFIAAVAKEAGLSDDGSATKLRFIQGDSMNPTKVQTIFNALHDRGYNSVGWGIFGVGGWLRNTATRDLFSSAYKLCACGRFERVAKLSHTPAKMSIPGLTSIVRDEVACFSGPSVFPFDTRGDDVRLPAYINGKFFEEYDVPFCDIQDATIKDFDRFADVSPFYGDVGFEQPDVCSEEIRALQKDLLKKHQS
ncbi:MAG: hypothetical protein MN733_28440, partial [Nitrososphaera sp.]|nr:hypothetical protein [Nitrososphaera sp.]